MRLLRSQPGAFRTIWGSEHSDGTRLFLFIDVIYVIYYIMLFIYIYLWTINSHRHDNKAEKTQNGRQWAKYPWVTFLFPQTATAWRCFTFSKQPVAMTSEPAQQASHMATVSSPSVINHVMHASYGEVRFANISLCVAAICSHFFSCILFLRSFLKLLYCSFPPHTENIKGIIGLRLWRRLKLKPSSSSGTAFPKL